MELIPIYRSFSRIMLTKKEWVIDESLQDFLVVVVDLRTGGISQGPWSGQKILKSDEFEAIPSEMRESLMREISEELDISILHEAYDLLSNPDSEVLGSLVK